LEDKFSNCITNYNVKLHIAHARSYKYMYKYLNKYTLHCDKLTIYIILINDTITGYIIMIQTIKLWV